MLEKEAMKITIRRVNDQVHFESRNETGNTVLADGAPHIGGQGLGMRPMEMLVSALGNCSAIDVVEFLRKMRQGLETLEIELEGKREEGKHPSLFTEIHLHYRLSGELDPRKVEKALSLSVDKYCSVARHLEKTVELSYSFSINGGEKVFP